MIFDTSPLTRTPLKLFGVMALALLFSLSGCEQEGPAERAGEEIDEAVEESAEELEEATDEMRDEVE